MLTIYEYERKYKIILLISSIGDIATKLSKNLKELFHLIALNDKRMNKKRYKGERQSNNIYNTKLKRVFIFIYFKNSRKEKK